MIPFSLSNLFNSSPEIRLSNNLFRQLLTKYVKGWLLTIKFGTKPWGIHVSLIESLRFLLLNAVMIPITKKTFWRSLNCSVPGFVTTGDPSSLLSALAALAAASCTSNKEIVLSKVLKAFATWIFHNIKCP